MMEVISSKNKRGGFFLLPAWINLNSSVDLSFHIGHLRLHFDNFIRNASGGALYRRQILLQPAHVTSGCSEIRFQAGQRSFNSSRLLQ